MYVELGLTWIIIVLILISILVTCTEVILRFGLISTRKGGVGTCAMQGSELHNPLLVQPWK